MSTFAFGSCIIYESDLTEVVCVNESFVDDDFIRKIVDKYSDMIFRVSLQYVRNKHDAEDVLQEVFLELLQYLHNADFQSDEHLKAWLIRVAINKSINVAKYNVRHKTSEMSVLLFQGERIKPQYNELKSILDKLSAIDREVIYLHYYEGYSAKEIAEIMNKTEKLIFKRLSRSRKKLKGYLLEGDE